MVEFVSLSVKVLRPKKVLQMGKFVVNRNAPSLLNVEIMVHSHDLLYKPGEVVLIQDKEFICRYYLNGMVSNIPPLHSGEGYCFMFQNVSAEIDGFEFKNEKEIKITKIGFSYVY